MNKLKNLFVTRSFLDRRKREMEGLVTKAGEGLALQIQHFQKEEKFALQSTVNRFLDRYYAKDIEGGDINHYISYYYETVDNHCNLGDYIQTIATERAIEWCLKKKLVFVPVHRNKLISHKGGTCVMQGWYEHYDLGFLPGYDTRAIWIGTHFNEVTCKSLSLLFQQSTYKPFDVGCRDKTTLDFCKQWGISSYFSRCLTLTLPRRSEEETAGAKVIYIVDCSDKIVSLLPSEIKYKARIISQREFYSESWQPWQKSREAAESLLDEYRHNACLVITTALHCAQPCIAMGIPVVFINPGYNERDRFSSMDGILHQYMQEDLVKGNINFNPKALDIEDLKDAMLINLSLSLKERRNEEEEANRMKARNIIESYSIL